MKVVANATFGVAGMGDFRVRLALTADAPRIANLCTQLGYATTELQIRERVAMFSASESDVVFVAEHERQVVGWAHVFIAHHLESETFAEVAGLVVDETFRGRGIGRSLLEAAAQWAPSRGLRQLRVRSNVLREEAHAFYLQLGFTKIKSQAVFSVNLPLAES